MRPDPGREMLERIHAELDPAERAMLSQQLRELGFRHVWDQVDRAGVTDPVEEGMFILDRLYPDMPAAQRASSRRQMQAAYERGEWRGFVRPGGAER